MDSMLKRISSKSLDRMERSANKSEVKEEAVWTIKLMNGYKLLKQAEKGLEIKKPASKQLKPLLRYYLSRNMKDQLIRAQSVMATKRHASLY